MNTFMTPPRMIDLVTTAILLGASYVGFQLLRPPFITVDSVLVQTVEEGVDAEVLYRTQIHRETRATWSVRVLGTNCQGSGDYTYRKNNRARLRTLSWYIGAKCHFLPGEYIMETCYRSFFGLREDCATPVAFAVKPRRVSAQTHPTF